MSEFYSETLSPGEAEFFGSGGTNAGALEAEIKGSGAAQVDASGQHLGQPSGQDAGQDGEPGQDAAQVGQQRDEKGRFVPLTVLMGEREKRKALEGELSSFREKYARVDERQKALNELLGLDPSTGAKVAQGAHAAELIDPERDIFGAFKQLQERYNQLEGKTKQVDQRFAQQTEEQALMSAYQSDARTFAGKTADFGEAYNHLLSTRARELEALGIADPAQRQQIMAQEEKQIAAQSLRSGRSAAETIYNLAKLRGYQGKQAQAAAPASVPNDAARQLEAAQKGREAFPTLSGTGSSAPAGLTADALAAMSEDEFARVFSKLSESEQRKLMGG